jgi:hypothetical protein
MDCHLLIPDLFASEAYREASAPALNTLLSRAKRSTADADGMEGWLCAQFGLVRDPDWPVAPLTLAADGGQPGSQYWLRADPVHLSLRGVELVLAPTSVLDITRAEAEALTVTLNRHFREETVQFHAPAPERWYVHLESTPDLRTHPPAEASGRNIESFLPEGADSFCWRGVFNEVQMLLHEHPVNVERESRGELPVNSVWFWGGGVKPATIAKAFDFVWADVPLVRALGEACGAAVSCAPDAADAWLQSASPGPHLITLDAPSRALHHEHENGWLDRLKQLEASWFLPLLRALKAGQLTRLVVTTFHRREAHSFETSRLDLWKIWRRYQTLPS